MAAEVKDRCAICDGRSFSTLFVREDKRKISQCLTCGLTQVLPRPTREEVSELYHEDFDHFRPYIEQRKVHREYFQNKIDQIGALVGMHFLRSPSPSLLPQTSPSRKGVAILKNARLLAPKALVTSRLSLLDIGCAMGILLEEAQKQGIAAYGIDISADAVKYCKKKGFTVWQGTAETAKIPKEKTFDIVTAFEVIEHEADPVAMMRRVYKLLKNGGIALITTPNHDTFWRKLMGKWWVGYRHPEHINFFNRRSLDELFRRVGFSQIIIKKDPPRPFPLSFLFIRSADYFPGMGWLLRPIGNLIHRLNITNPINPWDDIMVIGVK